MSVIEAADEAIRCLQKRRTEVRAQLDQFALIEAEIHGITDLLELQGALHQCMRLTNEVLQATQKVLEDSIAIALVNRERRSWRPSSVGLLVTRRCGLGVW